MDRPPHLAVLIDADNVPARYADALFGEIGKLGDATVRRIYGDFSGQGLGRWAERLAELAIVPQQQFNNTVGKNAADITLVIDAMDLLHRGRQDGFCLVSSDSDFTRLAQRLREDGCQVFGFGERKTPTAFRNACTRFIYLENLVEEPTPTPETRQPPSKAVPLILRALEGQDDDDGWVDMGVLGQVLSQTVPDFDSRSYGSARLSDLVAKTGAFEVSRSDRRSRLRRKR